MNKITTDKSYISLLQELKEKIRQTQVRAVISANQHLLRLYWEIGKGILIRLEKGNWGSKIFKQLSADLRSSFPDAKGFSVRNLQYMRQFALAYPDFEFVQAALAQISWYHNITLLSKCPDEQTRLWYAQKTLENGWSRNVMVHHIESRLFERQGKALTNFKSTLPEPQSDLAQETIKDPYLFNFLAIDEKAREKELEDALVSHITEFLLELGVGFAYIGRQVKLDIGKEEFFIDLLMYHTKLHAYVALELKTGKFKAEYAGKMNLYLSGLDELMKTAEDNPSIGMIICKSREKVVAEYALRDLSKPIGISEYKLTEALPEEFQSNLPSIEDIERELEDDKKG